MPNYNDPRYSENSKIEKDNERRSPADDDDWTRQEVDDLLDLYIEGTSGRIIIGELLGRTERSVATRLHTISAGNCGTAMDDYVKGPDWTACRAGFLFSKHDKHLTKLATGEVGRREGHHYPEYIAALLRREVEEVREWMLSLYKPGFGMSEKPKTSDQIAIMVHKCLGGKKR